MKNIRRSPICKLLAWLLLLACSFSAALFGVKSVFALPYVQGEKIGIGWQDNVGFSYLCQQWNDKIADAVANQKELDESQLTHVDRQRLTVAVNVFEASLDPNKTNFYFQLRDTSGKGLYDNLPDGTELQDVVEEIRYAYFVAGEHLSQNWDEPWATENDWANEESTLLPEQTETGQTVCFIEYGVPKVPQAADEFQQLFRYVQSARANLTVWMVLAGSCGVVSLLLLACVLWMAGCQKGEEEMALTWHEKIYTEFYLMGAVALGTPPFFATIELWERIYYWYYYGPVGLDSATVTLSFFGLATSFTLMVGLLALVLRTVAVRLRSGTVLSSTVLFRGVCWVVERIRECLAALSVTWKVILGFGLFSGFSFILAFTNVGRYNGGFVLLWFLVQLVVLLVLCWWTASFEKIRKSGQVMASGEIEYHVETNKMPADLKAHGEDLNNISLGLSAAVNEKMKSERFKAELITNVSHDLKTPLTSIINYVNLLKTTSQTDPKAAEYIEVLDRKSQRLKKLTEDLVEASKASTGVLNVNREKLDMAQLLDQALGEWEDKLADRRLSVIKTVPEGETWVYADGRHLWRIVDNLLSNCAKYAMEGTRIYLELTRGKGQVILSVKNISREALNVPPDRLMERFVRGEESRSSEGSGLGLSIARSLTELQGGTFEITVDGDLFKATVSLSQIS